MDLKEFYVGYLPAAPGGIAALIKIIANADGITTGKIYNIGNPRNNLSVRELAVRMLELAAEYPEYRDNAAKVK